MELLRDVPGEIYAAITGPDQAAITGPPPSVTVTVRRDSDDSVAVDDQNAVHVANGIFKYTVPAIDSVDLLRASWVVGTEGAGGTFRTEHEVVGGFMCTLEQVTEGLSKGYDVSLQRAARYIAESWLEHECGVAFRPRYARETLDGIRGDLLLANPRPTGLIAATMDDVALESGGIELNPAGELHRASGWTVGRGNVEVVYEHGFSITPPEGMRAAALLARWILRERPSNFDERATSYSTEEATYTLVTPGVRGAVFSIPEVNSFIASHSYPTVG